jgi:hypothetical protein
MFDNQNNRMDFRNLQFIFKPSFWVMNYPYSKEVDDIINDLLDNYEITHLGAYLCTIKGYDIWYKNYPYASCVLWKNEECIKYRPSRLTVKKFQEKIDDFVKKQK